MNKAMKVWKFASRWSAAGEWRSSILDVFVKNGIAFIEPSGYDLSGISEGDLIAIADGNSIVAVGKATTGCKRIADMPAVHLSEADKRKIGHCHNDIVGVRLFLPQSAILGTVNAIEYKHRKRFCEIGNPDLRERVIDIWRRESGTESRQDFDLKAHTKTLADLVQDKTDRLYLVPVFQRPYAWGEVELERFLSDIVRSYQRGGNMFIGTMQFSGQKWLSPRGEKYREVIDGQQRLTTCALLLKALTFIDPESQALFNFCRSFEWIETKVSSGEQQKRLDAVLHATSLDDSKESGTNLYLSNCAYLTRFLRELDAKDLSEEEDEPVRPLDFLQFFDHLIKKLKFVVIETEAGLSQTIQIFNTINTTGLDLNGGDLFKVRAYEYLTEKKNFPPDIFEEISSLYEKIDRAVTEIGTPCINIQQVLSIYQKILVGRYHLSFEAFTMRTETFFERLFDSVLGIKSWPSFSKLAEGDRNPESPPIVDLKEVGDLIKIRHNFEARWNGQGPAFDFQTRLADYTIRRTRYVGYWICFPLVEFCYPEEPETLRHEFLTELATLFVVFSLIYGKQVYEIHQFLAELIQAMIPRPRSETDDSQKPLTILINEIRQKSIHRRPEFEEVLDGDLASSPLPKKLIFRLLEALSSQPTADLRTIFAGGYDIEHIQPGNHSDGSLRTEIWEKWGVLLNSLGNLVLLESNVNRSIKNQTFPKKRQTYKERSHLATVHEVAAHPGDDWTTIEAESKREQDKARLLQQLFPNQSNASTSE